MIQWQYWLLNSCSSYYFRIEIHLLLDIVQNVELTDEAVDYLHRIFELYDTNNVCVNLPNPYHLHWNKKKNLFITFFFYQIYSFCNANVWK